MTKQSRMDQWKLICGLSVLVSVVSTAFGLDVTIPQGTYEVARGDEVAITCNFQPKNQVNRLVIISWTADPDGSFDDEGITFGTFYSNDNHLDIDPMYEGKAQIESNVDARVSKLILKHVTLRESRRIKCRVQIPGDDVGQTSATTSLVVLVAPSAPVCKIKGTAEYWQNISLTCVSDEGSPAPTYKWQSYEVSNTARPFPPKTTEKDGILSLVNVSKDTSGYYICTATNKIRSVSCNLTLSVMPYTMKIGSTAGIIGGCIAGIAVLVLIIYCACKKKKEKPAEFAMGPPEVEYHDIPKTEDKDEGPRDIRKTSIEGGIDLRDKYELKAENISNMQGSEDGDRNSNRRLNYDDRQNKTSQSQEDVSRDRDDDGRGYNRGRPDDRRDRHDDRRDHRERYDDRQGHRDHYDDHYDDHRDRYDDRQGHRDHYDDHYDDHRDRYDDRRDGHHSRQDRYEDHSDRYSDRFDDRRDRYDDRQDRYDDHRYNDEHRERYDDRQVRYDDHRDRYKDREDRSKDHRDR